MVHSSRGRLCPGYCWCPGATCSAVPRDEVAGLRVRVSDIPEDRHRKHAQMSQERTGLQVLREARVQRRLRAELQDVKQTRIMYEQDSRRKRQPQDRLLTENIQESGAGSSATQDKRELQEKLDMKERENKELSWKLQQGGTDLEKHRDLLVSENQRLKCELQLLKSCVDNAGEKELKERVGHLEQVKREQELLIAALQREVQQKADRLAEAELRLRDSVREKVEQEERLNRRLRECQQPQIKSITQKVEVECGKMKAALSQAQSRSMYLQEQVDMQKGMLQEMQLKLQQEHREKEKFRAQVEVYAMELERTQIQMMQEFQSLQQEKEQAVAEAFQHAQTEMRVVHHSLDGVRKNLLTLQPALRTLTQDYNALKRQVRDFPSLLQDTLCEARQEFSVALQSFRQTNDELLRKYRRELQLRKECHNQLVRLRGNIRVLARVRPVTAEDGPGSQNVVSFDQDDDGILCVAHKGKNLSFELDKVFAPRTTQEEVFLEVSPLITSCLDGYSVCILAYGQTGSGKTYSMEGPSSDPGINQRALRLLLSEVKERTSCWDHHLTVSMAEIYNESLRDLLGADTHPPLDIKMSPGGAGELYVPGLTQKKVESIHDINKILELGYKQRATEQTSLNSHSSRSHALLILTAKGRETSTGICTTGKLYLVDLAGSERVSRSGAAGERLREAQCINRSLSALGDVFSALRSNQGYIPYRNSKLTYLLQEPLSRDGKALLLLQVSPTEKDVSESLCSLRFGDRLRTVELGAPTRRVENSLGSTELSEGEAATFRGARNTSLRKKTVSSVRFRTGPT
ncbi:kinesin-like protein KIFC3 isoform X2 [Spea bombifrons]|uniref:kinesin-like protein KIFC3 isoform X2 n=1 Tax=Spea bombifrons TaxID=233779 RepID=UPI00234981DC|nr:kinesin-like protein KIFC3 isoform X2 [Spea bombifrons]